MADKIKDIKNSGFPSDKSVAGVRIVNRDGSNNIKKVGLVGFERLSIFHTLLKMPWPKFIVLVFSYYTVTNILFGCIYFMIGVDKLEGAMVSENALENFMQAFFFSSQTMTTVGYGNMAPIGLIPNLISSLESFVGIITFALVTGMFYARFSRPKAFIKFSDNFLIAPYRDGRALMFRIASFKNNHLTSVHAIVNAALHIYESDIWTTKYYPLKLEFEKISALSTNWTIVHPIDEESPFWGMGEDDFKLARVEILVTINAFDDHYSTNVQERTSYVSENLVYGAKFDLMYDRDPNENITKVHLDRINAFQPYSFDKDK